MLLIYFLNLTYSFDFFNFMSENSQSREVPNQYWETLLVCLKKTLLSKYIQYKSPFQFVCLFVSLEIMSSEGDQQSQPLTKPSFSEVQASALVESVFGLKVSKIQPLPSYDDQNFHVCIARTKVATDGPNEYVLKISNTESSKTPDLIEVQTHIIMFLRAAGFPTASVCRTKGDNITSLVSVGKRPPPVIARPCILLHFGYK